VTLLA